MRTWKSGSRRLWATASPERTNPRLRGWASIQMRTPLFLANQHRLASRHSRSAQGVELWRASSSSCVTRIAGIPALAMRSRNTVRIHRLNRHPVPHAPRGAVLAEHVPTALRVGFQHAVELLRENAAGLERVPCRRARNATARANSEPINDASFPINIPQDLGITALSIMRP